MDRKPRIAQRHVGYKPQVAQRHTGNKPSRLVTLIALLFAFSLPYLLVKHFSHRKHSDFTQQKIKLPQLEQMNSVESDEDYEDNEDDLTPVIKDNEWLTVKPRPGDSMAVLFHRLGLSAKNLHEVLDKNPHSKALTSIKPGQQLQFLINNATLEKLIIPTNDIQSLIVYKEGKGYKTKIESKQVTTNTQYVTAIVKGSLYGTAQQHSIPSKLMRQMTEILGKEVDFSRSVRAGDQFSMIYDAYYIEDKMVGTGDIQVVSYMSKGKSFKAVRHVNSNGNPEYFRPDGTSFKKAFNRYPIRFSHISSTFSLSRYHPILHYRRAHKGIDLAAPIGTPIQAAGDGVITTIGRHNGYGNMITIRHDSKFTTVYGHMLRFQRGMSRGSRVKRGQVIGFVGQTGLATGPHCHYELHVYNQPKNPTTIPLPTAASVPRKEMAAFKAKTNTLLARLKLIEEASIASNGRKHPDLG